jgi:acyl carrier protein
MMEELKKMIADKLGMDASEVKDDSSIVEDLKADSLDMVEISMALEDQYGVKIPDEAMSDFKTVGDIASYIAVRKAA